MVNERDLKSVAILVTDPPAAGKTTLGRQLAAELGWPFLCKDSIKEMLFDGIEVDTLYMRYVTRIEAGERHPGHVNRSLDRAAYGMTHGPEAFLPLEFGGPFVEIDTTDFATVDFDALVEGIGEEVFDG